MALTYEWRGQFTNAEFNALHAEAFDHRLLDYDWSRQVRRHSLGWVCARNKDELIGFVNVAWDGGARGGLRSPSRTSPVFGEPLGDELPDECLWKRLVDREVKGALRHRVALELIGELRQGRAAERQITQVVPKCGKACDGPTFHTEGRYTVGDDLFSLGHDLEDRAAKSLKRSALWLLERAQVRIDVGGGHRRGF